MQRPPSRPRPLPRLQPRATPRKLRCGAATRAAKAPVYVWIVCCVRDKRGCNLSSTLSVWGLALKGRDWHSGRCPCTLSRQPAALLAAWLQSVFRLAAAGAGARRPSPACSLWYLVLRGCRVAAEGCRRTQLAAPRGALLCVSTGYAQARHAGVQLEGVCGTAQRHCTYSNSACRERLFSCLSAHLPHNKPVNGRRVRAQGARRDDRVPAIAGQGHAAVLSRAQRAEGRRESAVRASVSVKEPGRLCFVRSSTAAGQQRHFSVVMK
jgi:hypothetical protein